MKKSWDARPMARSAATAGAMSVIPSCSIAPGRCASRTTSWRSSSATIRCRTRSGSTTSAAPGRSPPATSWPSSARSATPAGTTRRRSSRSSWTARTAGNTIPTAASRSCARSTRESPGAPIFGPSRWADSSRSTRRHDTLHRLFAGSWISHNFAIWVGHPEDNQAWDALHAARSFLAAEERSLPPRSGHAGKGLERDLHRRRAPTGSGGTATIIRAPSTALFDHLFRKHLRNVYTLLGFDPPGSLFDAISRGGGASPASRPAAQLFARQGRRPRNLL